MSIDENNFIPKNDTARIAVEKARKIVKDNNEMVLKIKQEFNLEDRIKDDFFSETSTFSIDDSYVFDLNKIKPTNGLNDFFKDIIRIF